MTKPTKLERIQQLENNKYDSDYIINFFCTKKLGFSKKCLLTSGLKDCTKCWNSEWEGDGSFIPFE
jgi:hypothetical protein